MISWEAQERENPYLLITIWFTKGFSAMNWHCWERANLVLTPLNVESARLTFMCCDLWAASTGWRTCSPHMSQESPWRYTQFSPYRHSPRAAYGQSCCCVSTVLCSFSESSLVTEPCRGASVQEGAAENVQEGGKGPTRIRQTNSKVTETLTEKNFN